MKIRIMFLSLCLNVVSLFAQSESWNYFPNTYGSISQHKVIDTAIYEISYQITWKRYSDPELSHIEYKDVQTLLVGKHSSATYSRDLLKERERAEEELKKGATRIKDFSGFGFPEDVFKGYPKTGELTTSYRLFFGSGFGQYTEALPDFKWQIQSETKEILGYKCQKALGELRGRKYIAWFAPDIPLSEGPWKFCGLPGLILAVQDTDGYFTFTCIGLEAKKKIPIRFWTYKHLKTTRTKLRGIIKRQHDNPVSACEQALGVKIYVGGRNDPESRNFSFEWLWLELE